MNHQDKDKDEHIPRDDPQTKQHGEQNRKEMDEVPPHGTDALHEGP
jgi:hypothetical protein